MNNWSVNDFPKLKAFCEENDISFNVYVRSAEDAGPAVFIDLHFDRGLRLYRHRLSRDGIYNIKVGTPAFENAMIDRLKKQFHIETEPALKYFYSGKYCYSDVINAMAMYNGFQSEVYKTMLNVKIKDVIFNDPATIVFWNDGTKTVVKAGNEVFDPEKGLAMAIVKKVLGNEGNYYNIFKQWIPELGRIENNCDTCKYKNRDFRDEPCDTCHRFDKYVKAKTEQENNDGR